MFAGKVNTSRPLEACLVCIVFVCLQFVALELLDILYESANGRIVSVDFSRISKYLFVTAGVLSLHLA